MPQYLTKRRRRWYAVLEIPKDLREHYGQRRLIQSLQTESLTEAERLKLSVIAAWKTEFEAIRHGESVPIEVQAKLVREQRAKADEDHLEILDLVLSDELEALNERSPELAQTYALLTKGKTISLKEHVEDWLVTEKNAPKTIDMKRSDVHRFIKAFPYSHRVNRKAVQRWAEGLMAEGMKATTARRVISSCKGYWDYLNRWGVIDREDAPFANIIKRNGGRQKTSNDTKRKPFSNEDVVTLLREAERRQEPRLRDLITLAMWTGCRIEELCSLRVEAVQSDRITITDSKTEAGLRTIPIHSKLAPELKRMVAQSSDGYVLPHLTFNKYGDRSNAIGKQFGRMKAKLGFGPDYVFHSIRKTVTTQLENAGVPENVSADILGHEKPTITYGLYSGGTAFPVMRDAIEKLSYPQTG